MTKKITLAKTDAQILNDMDLSVIAALEPELAAEAEVAPTPAPEVVETMTLPELVQNVAEVDRNLMLARIAAEFDVRAGYELGVNPENTNIQDTLRKQNRKMALPGIAGMMLATNVDPALINRSIAEGKRFNVYAIDKLNDLLHGLNSGHFKNEINIAVMRSLFKFRKAGVSFTGVAAAAAASDKVQVDAQMKALLVRHTVSASTAPTQSSSTMSALNALGVVTNKGSAKYPIWELTSNPVVAELEKQFAA